MDAEPKRRFPLRDAYAFATENGLADAATEIREMEIEWDRSYTSSVRSGRLIRLLEARGLLSAFISKAWPFGATPRGDAERRRCLRIADNYDAFLDGRPSIDEADADLAEVASLEFALEANQESSSFSN